MKAEGWPWASRVQNCIFLSFTLFWSCKKWLNWHTASLRVTISTKGKCSYVWEGNNGLILPLFHSLSGSSKNMFFLAIVVYGSAMFPAAQEGAAKCLVRGLTVHCFHTTALLILVSGLVLFFWSLGSGAKPCQIKLNIKVITYSDYRK